ncbi:MYB DNA-binding domain protein [Apiospora kogelbergensis]|uniref:MYB DNA-binding domain protein n=1 Tax=Apiospora kogelbergensis TaxID=1337665 RepID=A0AAW0QFJ4_9PEZI
MQLGRVEFGKVEATSPIMQQWQVGPVPEYLYQSSAQHANDMHSSHPYQQADMNRRPDFTGYAQQANAATQQQHHPQQHQQPHHGQHPQQHPQPLQHQQHQQHPQHVQHAQHPQHPQHQHPQQPQQHHTTPVQPPMTIPQAAAPPQQQQPTPTPAPAQPPQQRGRKRPAPQQHHPQQHTPSRRIRSCILSCNSTSLPTKYNSRRRNNNNSSSNSSSNSRSRTLRRNNTQLLPAVAPSQATAASTAAAAAAAAAASAAAAEDANSTPAPPPAKKSRTNTPWTPAEEQRLKAMRDQGASWAEIAKTFPTRTEGSVKKHWYKDMHYAEFAEDESHALLTAIKEYENNKWKSIGQKVGKPAKACEQYAKEHFPELFQPPKAR